MSIIPYTEKLTKNKIGICRIRIRYSADPDPHQNEADPKHWWFKTSRKKFFSSFLYPPWSNLMYVFSHFIFLKSCIISLCKIYVLCSTFLTFPFLQTQPPLNNVFLSLPLFSFASFIISLIIHSVYLPFPLFTFLTPYFLLSFLLPLTTFSHFFSSPLPASFPLSWKPS